jgi:hypothetical protein
MISFSSKCDVIHIPYPFTGICYSIEAIYSLESFKKPRNTSTFWVGFGHVGSIVETFEKPFFGLEAAIEKRFYFKPDKYKNFFVSAYLGTAYMTDFDDFSSIGLVPGLKLNYKIRLYSTIILEPYMSLSFPITRELSKYPDTIAFPALTFGARFGINKLKDKSKK